MNDVYLLRPDVNASQKEDFLNSFGEDCYFDEDDKIKFFKFSFEFTPHDYAIAKYICMDARHWKELILY